MGMFDTIRIETALPDGRDPTDLVFQTKDTPAQILESYRITEDGRLLERRVDREWLEDENAFFGGVFSEIPGTERWVEIPLHGDLVFYTNNIRCIGPQGYVTKNDEAPLLLEYTARFTDGELEWIRGGVAKESMRRFRKMKQLNLDEWRKRLPVRVPEDS